MAEMDLTAFEEWGKKVDEKLARFDEDTISLWEELILPIKSMESEAVLARNVTREINRIKNLKWGKWIWFALILVINYISGIFATTIQNLLDNEKAAMVAYWIAAGVCVGVIIIAKKKYIQLKVKKQEEIYNTYIENLNKMKSGIADKLSRVPQEYWNSYALDFMVKQYRSGRVDTVKEARIAYDRHCHELRMEKNQEEIIRQNNQMLRNQAALGDQMRRDTDDIILSMFLK